MNVPLLDLKRQYRSIKAELDEAVERVVESQHFVLGPEVEEFERRAADYLGVEHALGVSSGTDALLLALMAVGVGPGDEVIVPTFSFFATAGVVARLGATPVFVDVDPESFNIDAAHVRAAITSRTRAIIPVHLFGQVLDCDEIVDEARERNVTIVEDAAQAFGARLDSEHVAGAMGDVGCFSFFPSKNLGAFGDAGMVVTNDRDKYDRMQMMRVHGGRADYVHDVVGGNFRIDALQAAVLATKLPHLDQWSERRRRNAFQYADLLRESGLSRGEGQTCPEDDHPVALPVELPTGEHHASHGPGRPFDMRNHIYNQFVVRVWDRDGLLQHLKSESVGCAVYYPVPFHAQACFADVPASGKEFPNADRASTEVLALPVFPELTYDEQQYVVETIQRFYH